MDFIFIHNPKTGGETIETLLKIKKNHNFIYHRKNEIKNKYSFTFVRNPISRIVSWYNHLIKHTYLKNIESNELNDNSECYKALKNNEKIGPEIHRKLAENNNINDYIKIIFSDINKYNIQNVSPLTHQYKYVFDEELTRQLVTEVFRFEDYENQLIILLKKIKKDNLIKKINKTNFSIKKSQKLTSESLNLIYNYFKKDFELFNYKISDYNNI